MPLGVPLITLRRLLRAEIGSSLNPLQGIAAQQSLDLILDRQQTELWDAYNWKHLRIYRDVPLAAGQFSYNYPEGLPFEQVITAWFADGPSGRWRPLLYGISLGMIPAAGPMRGTPCRWDNVEGGTPPPPSGNTPPTITSDGGGPTATVTIPTSAVIVTTVTAVDPDVGQTLTYSIVGGVNSSLFTINPVTGVLSFLGAPGPEPGPPALRASAGSYNVIVQVSDGHGGTDSQDITVTVHDPTPGNTPPTITSDGGGPTASKIVLPGNTFVTTVTATDPDVGQTMTYSIIGGVNAGLFTIGASTGVLSLLSGAILGASYDVLVQVSDGHGGTDTQQITINSDAPRAREISPYVLAPTEPIGQLALLPVPASSTMLLRLEGQAAINPLVADNDKCVIDSRLITLFAAAEILANQKSEGAGVKLSKAQNYLRRLLANQAADKRVNRNMGGSQRYGNDPDKLLTQRPVAYLDYIPS